MAVQFWRITVAWLVMLGLFLLVKAGADLALGPYSVTRHAVAAAATTILVVPSMLLLWRYWDRRPLGELGLGFDGKAFAVGALSWLIPSLAAIAVLQLTGAATIAPLRPWPEILGFIPVLVFLVFFLEALPEELAFRGYIQTQLGGVFGRWAAAGLQAVLFAAWGIALWTWQSGELSLDRLGIFLGAGFVLGLVRATTGSIWGSIGLHLAFQTVAQLLLSADRQPLFAIDNLSLLTLAAIGIVPFGTAALLVELAYASKQRR